MKFSPIVEKYRVKTGEWATPPHKTYGMFFVPYKTVELKVIVCDGEETGWEHVSVSLPNRCPNWERDEHDQGSLLGEG